VEARGVLEAVGDENHIGYAEKILPARKNGTYHETGIPHWEGMGRLQSFDNYIRTRCWKGGDARPRGKKREPTKFVMQKEWTRGGPGADLTCDDHVKVSSILNKREF